MDVQQKDLSYFRLRLQELLNTSFPEKANDQKFIEENGRKLFLLYLKPIINGTGNYYIEARTRDSRKI